MLKLVLAALAFQAVPGAAPAAAPAVAPAAPIAPHYVMRATFAPDGQLDGDVTITMPAGTREKSCLLARRFAVDGLELPPGVALTGIARTDSPVEDLLRYTFAAAPDLRGPMTIRMRYAGQINPASDGGVRPMRDEGFELRFVVPHPLGTIEGFVVAEECHDGIRFEESEPLVRCWKKTDSVVLHEFRAKLFRPGEGPLRNTRRVGPKRRRVS